MEFLVVMIQTIVKMLLIAAVAFGGICLGRHFREKKDAKQADQTDIE